MPQRPEDHTDPAREGLDHLQAAAREMIAAARSMLDACEELLEDPSAGEMLASVIGSVTRAVGGLAGLGGRVRPHDAGGDDESSRVQRIKIS